MQSTCDACMAHNHIHYCNKLAFALASAQNRPSTGKRRELSLRLLLGHARISLRPLSANHVVVAEYSLQRADAAPLGISTPGRGKIEREEEEGGSPRQEVAPGRNKIAAVDGACPKRSCSQAGCVSEPASTGIHGLFALRCMLAVTDGFEGAAATEQHSCAF